MTTTTVAVATVKYSLQWYPCVHMLFRWTEQANTASPRVDLLWQYLYVPCMAYACMCMSVLFCFILFWSIKQLQIEAILSRSHTQCICHTLFSFRDRVYSLVYFIWFGLVWFFFFFADVHICGVSPFLKVWMIWYDAYSIYLSFSLSLCYFFLSLHSRNKFDIDFDFDFDLLFLNLFFDLIPIFDLSTKDNAMQSFFLPIFFPHYLRRFLLCRFWAVYWCTYPQT